MRKIKQKNILIILVVIVAAFVIIKGNLLSIVHINSYYNPVIYYNNTLQLNKTTHILLFIGSDYDGWYDSIYRTPFANLGVQAPVYGSSADDYCGQEFYNNAYSIGTWVNSFTYEIFVNNQLIATITPSTPTYTNQTYIEKITGLSASELAPTGFYPAGPTFGDTGAWYMVNFTPKTYGNYSLQAKLNMSEVINCDEYGYGTWSSTSGYVLGNLTPVLQFQPLVPPTTTTIPYPIATPASFNFNNIISQIQSEIQSFVNAFLKALGIGAK